MSDYTSKQSVQQPATAATGSAAASSAGPGKRTLIEAEPATASGVVQRSAAGDGASTDNAPRGNMTARLFGRGEAQQQALGAAAGSSGAPLPATMQGKLETSFASDLSGVRVHTGAASEQAAQAVGAKAYTVGQDIHFAAGRFDPGSDAGQHLLAHEVAHTVQQRGSAPVQQNQLEVSSPHDAAEHEADSAADSVMAGQPVGAIGHKPAQIARDLDPHTPAPAGPVTPPFGPAPQLPAPQPTNTQAPAPAPQQQQPPTAAGPKVGTNGLFPDSTPTVALRKWNYVVYADHVRLGNRAIDESHSGLVIGSWPWLLNNPGDLTGDVGPRKENANDPKSAYRQDKRVWGDPVMRGSDPGHMNAVTSQPGLDAPNAAIPGVAARHDLAIFKDRATGRAGLKDWILKNYATVTLAEAINIHLGPASTHVAGVDDPVAYPKRMQEFLNDTGGGKFAADYVQKTTGNKVADGEWDGVIDAFGFAEGYFNKRQVKDTATGKSTTTYVENKGIIYRKAKRDSIDVDPLYKTLPRVTAMPEDTPPEIIALLGPATPP